MWRLCIFCGSKTGSDAFAQVTRQLGRLMAQRGIGLVYGGGSVGLMGVLADAVLDLGGDVIGVIPHRLATKELLHPRVEQMHRVPGMHERKALMAELADAFVALPGGYGTLEELFEIITWAQLGIHRKNIGLLNIDGFYHPLLDLIDHAIAHGFIKPAQRDLLLVESEPALLLDRLAEHTPPKSPRWLSVEES